MGLGKRRNTPNITPAVKFDARNGHMYRLDRNQNGSGEWTTDSTDITHSFAAVMALDNTEIGHILLVKGQTPDFRMVAVGEDVGDPPSDKHKEGFRLKLVLRGDAAVGDGDVREFVSPRRCGTVWISFTPTTRMRRTNTPASCRRWPLPRSFA
jgi:hypothetical protein